MEFGEVYFWTSTIVYWKKLFQPDIYKEILLNSLESLIERECIAVYGLVIMPNHIHLIWEMIKYNGKEMPDTSFIKFTAHQIKKELDKSNPKMLDEYKTDKNDREYQFWQRDALAIRIFSRDM
jgi:putative transposase